MTNIRRQLTVIKSNAHTHPGRGAERDKGAGCDSCCHAHASPSGRPIWGLCSSNIFATISFRLLGKFTFSYAAIFNRELFDFISTLLCLLDMDFYCITFASASVSVWVVESGDHQEQSLEQDRVTRSSEKLADRP